MIPLSKWIGSAMYLIGFLVLLGIAYFYFASKKKTPSSNLNSLQTIQNKSSAGSKQGATSFDSPIPKDCQIFAKHIPVAGLEYRKAEALKFAKSSNQILILQKDSSNEHDSNAIKLIGISGSTNYFIGYLPKELSAQITGTGLFDSLTVRLVRIFIGNDDFLDIHYQIIGPKVEKKKFDDFLSNQPVDSEQKEYLKFFNLPSSKGLTFGQAKQTIEDHKKNATDEVLDEWNGYNNIFEEFEDKEFRETYDLKRVSRTVILEAINQLKAQGKTYSYLSDNIEEIVEKIIEIKPDLEKKA